MVAHYRVQTWNGAELARALGVSAPPVRHYLDVLTSALMIRQLPPWFANVGKRQVKSLKIYITDSGLLHTLLNLPTQTDLEGLPKVGASWEGFVLGEVVTRLGVYPEGCFFWATHARAELDLLVVRGIRRWEFEFKRTVAPRTTQSMHSALKTLDLQRLDIIHAGNHTFALTKQVHALALKRLLSALADRRPRSA